jgi:hypothetical protein
MRRLDAWLAFDAREALRRERAERRSTARSHRKPVTASMKAALAARYGLDPFRCRYTVVPCRWCGWWATLSWDVPDDGGSASGLYVRLHQGFQWDHYMPLALGGAHEVRNIEPICAWCNARKGAKHPDEFASEMTLRRAA